MFTPAQCRAFAEKKLAQAENDERHRRRLINAAEAWFFLANRLSGEDTGLSMQRGVKKKRSKKHARGNTASTGRAADDFHRPLSSPVTASARLRLPDFRHSPISWNQFPCLPARSFPTRERQGGPQLTRAFSRSPFFDRPQSLTVRHKPFAE
jgi:hypothetical protein